MKKIMLFLSFCLFACLSVACQKEMTGITDFARFSDMTRDGTERDDRIYYFGNALQSEISDIAEQYGIIGLIFFLTLKKDSDTEENAMKKFLPLLFVISAAFAIWTGCARDPFQGYEESGIEAKPAAYDDLFGEDESFGYDTARLFTDHQSYSAYGFDLGYTEEYFEANDLLVAVVCCGSSDEMKFCGILQKDGKLFPAFSRKKIKKGEPVADDFIVLSFYAEIPKSKHYGMGEILFEYR